MENRRRNIIDGAAVGFFIALFSSFFSFVIDGETSLGLLVTYFLFPLLFGVIIGGLVGFVLQVRGRVLVGGLIGILAAIINQIVAIVMGNLVLDLEIPILIPAFISVFINAGLFGILINLLYSWTVGRSSRGELSETIDGGAVGLLISILSFLLAVVFGLNFAQGSVLFFILGFTINSVAVGALVGSFVQVRGQKWYGGLIGALTALVILIVPLGVAFSSDAALEGSDGQPAFEVIFASMAIYTAIGLFAGYLYGWFIDRQLKPVIEEDDSYLEEE